MPGNDRDAKREAGRRHDADIGISATNGGGDPVNQNTGEQRPEPAADKKIKCLARSEHRATENSVGQAVADVAHAPQDDIDTDKAAERADHYRCNEAVTKEFVFEGN